ncbi:sugar phosphate isomerase/epimerase family protein [Falsiroseomonas sp.]|uniref:sugar phosphate isomerase/epimerase family protein n=1 Tax=Falsiroseomonas sp. TaxID=2870721 RepID=UPI00356530AC
MAGRSGIFGGTAAERLRRLSFNFYMAPPDCGIERFCAMAAARGVGGVGLTARALHALPPDALADLLRMHGLACTSLNSTGYVLHADPAAAAAQAALDDLLFDAAQALGAPINAILGGTLHAATAGGAAPPLRDARASAAEGLERLARRARAAAVRLALEPMHPIALGTKGCINQVSHARALAVRHPEVGLTLDLYHSWWDEDLTPTIAAATNDILVVQICGLAVPADGTAPRRAELAAGPADVGLFLRDLDAAGYGGAIEYEVFWDQMGQPDLDGLLDRAARDYLDLTGDA